METPLPLYFDRVSKNIFRGTMQCTHPYRIAPFISILWIYSSVSIFGIKNELAHLMNDDDEDFVRLLLVQLRRKLVVSHRAIEPAATASQLHCENNLTHSFIPFLCCCVSLILNSIKISIPFCYFCIQKSRESEKIIHIPKICSSSLNQDREEFPAECE